ncbi:MAG: phosphatase PAP2 family protein, partial [Nocardioides sp.]
MTIATIVLASVLLVRKQPRAALLTVAVMVATSLATTGAKALFARGRPEWQDSVDLLSTQSFPSGHASSVAAFTGILVVLSRVFVRRHSMRRTILLVLVGVWLVVCLDRILLGRHYPSDVAAGSLLGVAFVLLGVVLIDPEPRGHAEKSEPLPEVYATQRRLAVIVNPIKVEDVGQFRAIVSQLAGESGWSPP